MVEADWGGSGRGSGGGHVPSRGKDLKWETVRNKREIDLRVS